MKLSELVKYLDNESSLEKLYQERNLDNKSESILAYMKDELSIGSHIYFFPVEDTDDELKIEREGICYYQLFPLELGVEFYSYFIDEFETGKYSESDKAERLLKYVINDA